jgi:sugar phosphate isomerase/epimerase
MASRRQFLAWGGASLLLAGKSGIEFGKTSAAARSLRFHGPYGLELYSFRNQMKTHARRALREIRDIGYTEVEVVYDYWGPFTEAELRKHLDQAGLKCTSAFYPPFHFRESINGVIAGARTLGARSIICGSVPGAFGKKPLTLDDYKRAAEIFNRWGRQLRAAGMAMGYHNHNYEFKLFDGKPAFDTLINMTDPRFLNFEMDVFWVKAGGQDPVAYLKRYPSRFKILHLKDMRKGTPIPTFSINEVSPEASVALGRGILNMPAILREAAHIGIRRYYVEDESAEAPENVKVSYEYLKNVRF